MPKKFVEKLYDLEEDEIQELIVRAQAKDQAAQQKLLDVFDNYLQKYITLLYYGKYNLSEYDTRRFIGLFVKDGLVRSFLMRNKLTPQGYRHVNECLRGITYMTQRYGEEADVQQTVTLAFLQCVSIYKRRGQVPFKGFLYSYFFYILKKMVDQLLIDQLGRKTFPLIDNDDAMLENDGDGERPPGFPAPPVPGVEDLLECEEVDEYWVAGDTAHGAFAGLSIQERQLLKWRYVDRERPSTIAARITEHQNTVRENFHRIRVKVRKYIEEDIGEIG